MQQSNRKTPAEIRENWKSGLVFCAAGILLNLIGAQAALLLHIPLYLDNVGTLLTAALGGYVPGIIAGYLTNLINGIKDTDTIFYGVLSVMIAVSATFMTKRGCFKKISVAALAIVLFALIGGALGSVLTWFIYGMEFGQGIGGDLARKIYALGGFSQFAAQISADFLIDLVDKSIVFLVSWLLIRVFPEKLKPRVRLRAWQQTPIHGEERRKARLLKTRGMSLRAKIVILVSIIMVLIALVTTVISYGMFHRTSIETQAQMASGVTRVMAKTIDPEKVDLYLEQGKSAAGYAEAESAIRTIRDSSPDIQYAYVYKILPDGCHVVFDPDTEEMPGSAPGDVIAFEGAFEKYLPALLAGEEIEPVISNGVYGWLLSVYTPVLNSRGECVCYACADISMQRLQVTEYSFMARAVSLFVAFFVLIMTVGLWLAEYGVILPINSIALATSGFAYDSGEGRRETVEQLKKLDIHTGDEIENLYQAVAKTSEDTMQYIADVQKKNETIAQMQDSLIAVLADLVESRDLYTGNHVKHTAEYAGIIAEQLRRKGIYADQLTDDFIRDLVHSAPLHDVGKIKIPDALLNKPARLTDEEFERMKRHTIAGREIIAKAAEKTADGTYLKEAQNLAAYHHERWDGKGYPFGLAGEDIPLSARIMAVADVFDALISKRSYKEGYSLEKSFGIIREGIGTHFDPQVAQAFLEAEEQVRAVVETRKNDTLEGSV